MLKIILMSHPLITAHNAAVSSSALMRTYSTIVGALHSKSLCCIPAINTCTSL